MKTIKVTPSELAKMRGHSVQAITKAIRKAMNPTNTTMPMPGVKKIEKYGRSYVLTIQVEK